MAQKDAIQTGTESDDRSDAEAVAINPDIWAFADDGEHATTWAIERVDDDTVRVETHRHEAGLDDVVTGATTPEPAVERFDLSENKPTEEFARELADSDPEVAVEAARDHFKDESDE